MLLRKGKAETFQWLEALFEGHDYVDFVDMKVGILNLKSVCPLLKYKDNCSPCCYPILDPCSYGVLTIESLKPMEDHSFINAYLIQIL